MQTITLSNETTMPLLGFGVFQIPEAAQCEQAVLDALRAGYRLIDTAAAYLNEQAVGAAIRKSGVPRDQLFVTTKLWVQDAGYERTLRAFQNSLDKLGLNYLDLYLIHQPMGDYYGAWRALEELYEAGRVRAIGVCNFYPDRLTDLCLNARIAPMVNQIECHPLFQQSGALENMRALGVQPQAWGPLAEGAVFADETLQAIAARHGKSVAQIALRWNVQRGVVVIPKSVHADRITQNADLWDFALSDDDMQQIALLDRGHSEIIDHSTAATARYLNGFRIHD